jgi:hypothetical protein
MATWQFVADMASASPSVLLDINARPLMVGDGWKINPASYEKGYSGGPMRHGRRPTRSTAANLTLVIPLQVLGATNDAAATVIQNLGHQLRVDNILKVQHGSNPVFFRTFANPEYSIDVVKTLVSDAKITLQIEAEPFAYGPRVQVTGSPFTLSNNPAAGSNPMHIDITGVLGDVETPLFLIATSTGASNGLGSKWSHVATRRRGTPSGYSNVVQAESMTLGTNAVVTADAAFSGGSKLRITPGTATHVIRANSAFPSNGVSTVEARGEYIVYARVAKTTAADVWTTQLKYGVDSVAPVENDTVTLPLVAGPFWVNLGKVPVPAWSDPGRHGFSGVSTKVVLPWVGFYAGRSSGSGSLDFDCLYFVPADESTVIVQWPTTDTTYVLDGTTDEGGSAYAMNTALDEVLTTATPARIHAGGGFPELIPGQTNRIHMIRQVDPAGTVDGITNTTTLRAYYWPRWREFTRP